MKTANFWKKRFIITTFFIVASPQLLESTIQVSPSGNLTKNMTCDFTILDAESVKRKLDQFVLVDSVDLVSFNIEVNQEFLDETAYDNIHENGILRWIWVFKSKTDILSYPVDLDGITLQLAKSTQRTIDVSVNATAYLSNYSICVSSLYKTLSEQLLDKNSTDWKFCHRYFKGQQWKHVMNNITGSWLGYDFECFNTFCSDIKCAEIVEKGTVNIVIDLFIFLLCINLPLFYLFLPKRQNISPNHTMHYHKGDSPYSFARIFLHLNKNFQTVNEETGKTFPEFLQVLWKDSSNLNPEAKVLSFFYFVLLGVFILQTVYLRRAIADYDKYVDIYQPYIYGSDDIFTNISLFTCSFFMILPLLLVFMSYYGQSENTFFSFNPFGIIDFNEIDKQQDNSIKYTGYTQFANKFLTRISFFFKRELWIKTFSMKFFLRNRPRLVRILLFLLYLPLVTPLNIILYTLFFLVPMIPFIIECFILCPVKYIRSKIDLYRGVVERGLRTKYKWYFFYFLYIIFLYSLFIVYFIYAFKQYFLFTTQFLFKLIVYTIFVAGPLFSTSQTSYQFWAISLAVLVYSLKFTMTFNSNYKYLLEKLLKLKQNGKEKRSETTCNSNTDHIEDINSSRQSFSLANKKKVSIHVELFEQIAREFMPLRIQLFILFLKLFFTGIFLYVTFDSISKGGSDGFLVTQIPLIITVVMPGIAERLVSSSNIEDDIQTNEDDITFMIMNYKPSSLNVNSCDNDLPATAEGLCPPSKDDIKMNEKSIRRMTLNNSPTTLNKDVSDNKVNKNVSPLNQNHLVSKHFAVMVSKLFAVMVSKHFAVMFPIIYTCKCVITSIFFCCKECEDEIDIEVAPEDTNSIRDGRNRGDYNPI